MHQQEMAVRVIDDVEMSMSDVRACNKQQNANIFNFNKCNEKIAEINGENVARARKKMICICNR